MKKTIQHLLCIEDNDDHFDIMSFYLESLDASLSIQRFCDGQEAMSAVDELTQNPPDLILLDLNLPKYSGLEILEQYKQHQRLQAVPVVVYTTSNSQKDIQEAYQRGANSYLMKSLEMEQGKRAFQVMLDYWNGNEKVILDQR